MMKRLFLLALCASSMMAFGQNKQPVKKQENGVTVFTLKNAHMYLDKANVKVGDEIVINGPLFDGNGDPVGGYITRVSDDNSVPDSAARKEIKQTTDTTAGGGNFKPRNYIFGQNTDGRYFMIPYDANLNLSNMSKIDFAIQNGMALVVNGQNTHNAQSTNVKTRIGIGFNSKTNELIVVDSQRPITFYELAEIFRKNNAENALYLDGAATGYIDDLQQTGNLPATAQKIHLHY